MILVMYPGATPAQVEAAIEKLSAYGFDVHRSSGEAQVVLGAIGVQPGFDTRPIEALEGVAEVHRITQGYRLASRLWQGRDTVVEAGDTRFGGGAFGVIGVPGAGLQPEHARALAAEAGVSLLFSGCHPMPLNGAQAERDNQQGRHAAEVVDVADIAATDADLLVVGPERMGHIALLQALSAQQRPVLLYRSASATVGEWLAHADVLLAGGNRAVLLCESGIRTFETTTHRTLDLSSIPAVQARSHLPILVDPGYGTGQPRKMAAMARAAVAAGADGLVVEMHPAEATADVPGFVSLMAQLHAIRHALQ